MKPGLGEPNRDVYAEDAEHVAALMEGGGGGGDFFSFFGESTKMAERALTQNESHNIFVDYGS